MEYDTALKKLINILKFKNTDTIRKIEDFWDELSTVNIIIKKVDDHLQSSPNQHHQSTSGGGGGSGGGGNSNSSSDDKLVKPGSGSTTIKRSASQVENLANKKQKITNNIINNQTQSIVKQSGQVTTSKSTIKPIEQKLQTINKIKSPPLSSHTTPLSSQSTTTTTTSAHHDTLTNNIEMTIESEIEFDSSSSKKSSSSSSSSNNDDLFANESINGNNIDEYVMEMGLTCDICKLLVQEQNNKLAECQECKRLYHQKCHKPIITNEEISDPRMLWYCSKCAKTVKKQITNNVNNTIKSQQKSNESSSSSFIKTNGIESSSSSLNQTKQQQPTLTNTQIQFKRQTSSESSLVQLQQQQQQQLQPKTQHESTSHTNEPIIENNNNNNSHSNNDSSNNASQKSTTPSYFKRDPKQQQQQQQQTQQTNELTKTTTTTVTATPAIDQQHQQQQQQQLSSNNKALKGLAGLATKFNSSINKEDQIAKSKPFVDNQLKQQQQQQQPIKPPSTQTSSLYNQLSNIQQKLKQNGTNSLTNNNSHLKPSLTSFKQTILLESVPSPLHHHKQSSTTTTTTTTTIIHDNNNVKTQTQNNVDFLKTKQLVAKAKIS